MSGESCPDICDIRDNISQKEIHSSRENFDGPMEGDLGDRVVRMALNSGVDLREYSKMIQKQLASVEAECIQDYVKESENIASLHSQIEECDFVMEGMEKMLRKFQLDLSSISGEIHDLQKQSCIMNKRLSNRQLVRGELSQFVEEMIIPEKMISHILETPAGHSDFLEQLQELNHKIAFVRMQSFHEARACQDILEVLEKLKSQAVIKVREYLLQKIFAFRKPLSNYQIPQNALLKHKVYNEFLMTNDRDVAKEMKEEYVDTMSKVYFSYFKSYDSRLSKLMYEEVPTKDDLMGSEDVAKRTLFSGPRPLRNKSTVFTLGTRGEVLFSELEAAPLLPHAVDKKYPYEALFRSMQYALVDNACREYLFLKEFFLLSESAAHDLFNSVMNRTVQLITKSLESWAASSYDSIALFLCIHMTLRFRLTMQQRNVSVMESYWKYLLRCLWPRFQHVLELNIRSVADCDPSRLSNIDTRPHYITRRFAEFFAGIVVVDAGYPQQQVHTLLARLTTEVENFVLRLAAEFPNGKRQLVCFINNYDSMLQIIVERAGESAKEACQLRKLLEERITQYVEEALRPHFGALMSFVRDCEVLLSGEDNSALTSYAGKVPSLVKNFNEGWKLSIEQLNSEVMQFFTNFRNGTHILQCILTDLVLYYQRFQKILSVAPFKTLPAKSELMNIHHLMAEVKKYKPTF